MLIYNTFTKDWILTKVTEKSILKHYLKINDFDIKISTPFRRDNVPSGVIYYNKHDNRPRFKDFGTFDGDCFDLVAKLNRINIKATGGFKRVLNIIAIDFKLLDKEDLIQTDKDNVVKGATQFDYTLCKFNSLDVAFWQTLNVTLKQLEKRRVYRLYNFFIDDVAVYRYDVAKPAYIFLIGRHNESKKIIFQAYFPYKDKVHRYINNVCHSKGFDQIRKDNHLLLVGSYKDLLVIDSFGLNVAATGNENKMVTEAEHEFILTKVNKASNVYTLFDNDHQGKKFSILHYQKYGYNCILMPKTKDPADFQTEFGTEESLKLVNKFKNNFL